MFIQRNVTLELNSSKVADSCNMSFHNHEQSLRGTGMFKLDKENDVSLSPCFRLVANFFQVVGWFTRFVRSVKIPGPSALVTLT